MSRVAAHSLVARLTGSDIRAFRGAYRAISFINKSAAIAVIYVIVARSSLLLASVNPSATPIWPTTGYALAMVMLLGYRISPAIFLGALIANSLTAGSAATWIGIAAGNTLESVVGAWLIGRYSGGTNTFSTPSGVFVFALICLVPSTLLSATTGVVSLALTGYATWADFVPVWTTWWMGDFAGALVVTPAIVLWSDRSNSAGDTSSTLQSVLVHLAAVVVGILAFSPLLNPGVSRTPLAFFTVLPLMWAALRCNQRDTATTALTISSFAVWGTLVRNGPFVQPTPNDSFLLLLAFMISVTVPSLVLSADVMVRRKHEQHINDIMHELSHRSKNLLSIIQSMANQVARRSLNFDSFLSAFARRLRAFADTHDLLVLANWTGTGICGLVLSHLKAFSEPDSAVIGVSGPDLKLKPNAAEQIGLALHELATNATKYGSLSQPEGKVAVDWNIEARESRNCFVFRWRENNGPQVALPGREGFGTLVLTRIVPDSLAGKAIMQFSRDGFFWELIAPVNWVLAGGGSELFRAEQRPRSRA